ncbi:MAG: metallophosphoesterase family protein [Candidatus Bipolaricaulota bacterium]
MSKRAVAVAITLVLLAVGGFAQTWTALGPWATAVSPTEAVVTWKAPEPTTGRVKYAPAEAGPPWDWLVEPVNGSTGEPVATVASVRLVSLSPGTRYAYRVVLASGEESPAAFFSTPPTASGPFVFLVYGDTRTHYDHHRLVAEQMSQEEDAAFVVHLGDLVESPSDLEWGQFLDSGADLFRSTGFYPVLGNHERNHSTYYELFSLPPGGGRGKEQWWSLRWGDVLLVGLDSNLTYLKFTGLRDQTDWLSATLAAEARYKFVFFHHPLYSSDEHYGGDEGLAKLWAPILREHNVAVVFVGHAHNYEHIVRDGVHYFVTGGGGAPLAPLSPVRVEGSVFGVDFVLHYLRVEVGEGGVTVRMIPVAREESGGLVPLDGVPLEMVELGGGGQ